MTKTLWANYSDAIKLILNGSTSKRLVGEQNIIFQNMLSRGMRDGDGNPTQNRDLEGVRVQRYCINEEQEEYEDMYYIPDLALYMLKTFDDWDISYPPVDLDYLNSLKDELGKPLFMFGGSGEQKLWEKTSIGKNHWTMICREIEIKQEMAELDRTHHGNDPLKLESQKRMRMALSKEMKEIEENIAIIEKTGSEDKKSEKELIELDNDYDQPKQVTVKWIRTNLDFLTEKQWMSKFRHLPNGLRAAQTSKSGAKPAKYNLVKVLDWCEHEGLVRASNKAKYLNLIKHKNNEDTSSNEKNVNRTCGFADLLDEN